MKKIYYILFIVFVSPFGAQWRKKIILWMILAFGVIVGQRGVAQQNLVPNYSFENISTCISSGVTEAIGWISPNKAGDASNLCNTCQTSFPNVPHCFSGYQWPRTGNGFVGIVLFDDTTDSYHFDGSREYIEIKLTDSMKPTKKYCVGFYTNTGNLNMWAIKNIQAALTKDSLLYFDNDYWYYIPGVTVAIESPSIVSDTLNWTKIRGVYTPIGGEKFITIGNFSPGSQVIRHLAQPHYTSGVGTGGYYLFDDISVYEQPDVFAGNDTTIAFNDSVILGTTGRSDIFYSWQPTAGLSNANIANPVAQPSVTTQYILTVTDTNQWACNSVLHDTVVISVGTSGIKHYADNSYQVSVYPNPAINISYCEVTLNKNDKGIVSISDLLGRELFSQPLTEGSNKLRFDIANLVEGVYLYKVIVNDKPVQSNKLIIQR